MRISDTSLSNTFYARIVVESLPSDGDYGVRSGIGNTTCTKTRVIVCAYQQDQDGPNKNMKNIPSPTFWALTKVTADATSAMTTERINMMKEMRVVTNLGFCDEWRSLQDDSGMRRGVLFKQTLGIA